MRLKHFTIAALALLISMSAMAQDQTGSIFGVVTTEDGAAIVGVKVTAESSSLIRPMNTVTNERGYYIFPALPIGAYTLTFEKDSYQISKAEDIKVALGLSIRVNPTLKTGVVGSGTVTITGEVPLIDVTSNETSMTIDKQMFETLPKGRNFESLVALAPGASDEDPGGVGVDNGIQIDGSSSSENVWVIDGVDTTSFYTGNNRNTAAFEFVEEIQVRSGGYEAEFGGSMGGVVNVITRSGGNEFHGSGTFYFNADELDAEPNQSLRIDPLSTASNLQSDYFRNVKDDYTRIEVGGGIGGYVLKDRIWFFGSYLPVFRDSTRTVNFRDSAGEIYDTRSFDRENTIHQASAKVTAQITDSLRFSASGGTDWSKDLGEQPSQQGTGNPDLPYDTFGDKRPGYLAAGNLDLTLTDYMFFNSKAGFSRTDREQLGVIDAVQVQHSGNITDFNTSGVPSQYIVPSGYNTGSNVGTERDLQQKYNWSGDLTFFTQGGGDHMFKGGLHYFRITQDIAERNLQDRYIIYWNQSYFSPLGTAGLNGVRGKYGYYRLLTAHPLGRGTVANIASNRYAIFAQDSWGITDRLTINVGVRAEKEDIPSFGSPDNPPPISFDFGKKVAPRIGFAYDVQGDGRWKIFGNFGVYYDVMKLAMAEGSYGGFKWIDAYFAMDDLRWDKLLNWDGSFGVDQNPLGKLYETVNFRFDSSDDTDPDPDSTFIREYIIGTEYQLSDTLAISFRGLYKQLGNLIEDVGVAIPGAEQYFIGNPGSDFIKGKRAAFGQPSTKALRHYWGLDMRLIKRFSDNWQGGINATLSRLTGNVSGLASTDEFGRQDPGVERYFDKWFMEFNGNWEELGKADNAFLPTHRPWSITAFGSYVFTGKLDGLVVGVNQSVRAGTPVSTDVSVNFSDGYLPNGRGDMGTTPSYSQTDLRLEYNFDITEAYRAQVELDIFNLWDQRAPLRIYPFINYDNVSISDEELLTYYNSRTPVNSDFFLNLSDKTRLNPLYELPWTFQPGRSIRLGMKLNF